MNSGNYKYNSFTRLILLVFFIQSGVVTAQFSEGFLQDVNQTSTYIAPTKLINCGNGNSAVVGSQPLHIAKFDSSINMIWSNAYNGPPGSYFDPFDGILTLDKGFLIAGGVSTANFSEAAQLIKVDSAGIIQWSFPYGNSQYDRFNTALQKADSTYIVAGFTRTFSTFSALLIVHVTKTGFILSSKSYHISNIITDANSSTVCSDGGYAIATVSGSILRFDANDNLVWHARIQGVSFNNNLTMNAIAESSDHGFILAGANINNQQTNDGILVKLDSAGNFQWKTIIDFGNRDDFYGVIKTHDGGYLGIGISNNIANTNSPACMAKVDQNGNFIWGRLGPDSCCFFSGYETPTGFFIAGLSRAFINGPGGANTYLGRFDSLGQNCSTISAGNTTTDSIRVLPFIPIYKDSVLFTGDNGTQEPFNLQYTSVCITLGTDNIDFESNYILSNPVTDKLTISRSDDSHTVVIKIYNMLGLVLKTISFSAGQNEIVIDVSEFPSAMYVVSLDDGLRRVTNKLIKN